MARLHDWGAERLKEWGEAYWALPKDEQVKIIDQIVADYRETFGEFEEDDFDTPF